MIRRNLTSPTARHAPAVAWALVGLLMLCLAGCGTVTSASPTPSAVLAGSVQPTSFTQVRRAIDTLYANHPDLESFQVQAVEYTPKTRDKVLKVCREGSLANTTRELETERVMGCAPLIYFFARYGDQRSVPQATTVARQLYWYAVSKNQHPYNSTKVLSTLLKSWGVK